VDFTDHTARVALDRQQLLAMWRSMLRADDITYRLAPLGTLGESLALCRLSLSASGVARGQFDVGAYENENIVFIGIDAQERLTSFETFAADRLGDALARLYERYAELLSAGPARERAAATARSVAVLMGPLDVDRWDTAFAPAIEWTDYRTVGLGSVHGAEAVLRAVRALLELVENWDTRVDDILDLRSDALVLRWTNFGTDRASGGAFVRYLCQLWVFGADGLVTRWEQSEADQEEVVLARFDELAAAPSVVRFASAAPADESPLASRSTCRRVRPNAATANLARIEAAIAARDIDAFPTLHADSIEAVHHPTGLTWGRDGALAIWRSQREIRDLDYRVELLATLGDSVALCRARLSARGEVGAKFDVAAWEYEDIVITDVDAEGRCQRCEFFAADRLGDAVARLYERYAELLPNGPARAHAAATARSVAALALAGRFDLDRWATAFAPGIEALDHRTVGFGSLHGYEAVMQGARAFAELSEDWAARVDDILALRHGAFLVARRDFGTWRAGGGAFERQLLMIFVFGADGLLTRYEQLDADRDDEALARFEELTAEPAAVRIASKTSRDGRATAVPATRRRVRANAATANAARVDAAVAARDVDAFATLFADSVEAVHHPTGLAYGRDGALAVWHSQFAVRDFDYRTEPLATLGDSIALCRRAFSASGVVGAKFDVGAYESEELVIIDVDADGRRRRVEAFAADRLGDAVTRLYERHAELLPDGPARERATATARSVAVVAWTGPIDLDRLAAVNARDLEAVDHRSVGFGSLQGAEAVLRSTRALLELSEEMSGRVDDIVALRHDALLMRWTTFGTQRAGGGAFERQVLLIFVFGADGLVMRWEQFDSDRDDEALARFDELAAEPAAVRVVRAASPDGRATRVRPAPRRVHPNAATAFAARFDAIVAVQEVDALPTLLADESEAVDHTTRTTWDRQGLLATWRSLLIAHDPTCRQEPLATLGDSLALCQTSISARGFAGRTFDVGAYEREEITLVELDAQGRLRRVEYFAADRLGDAIARLYERYAELVPGSSARARAAATARSVAVMGSNDDWTTALAPAVEVVDHRTLGTWSARGAEEMLRHNRALSDVADIIVLADDDFLCLQSVALLSRRTHSGTDRAGGGAYERQFIQLFVFGSDGLLARLEYFDADRDGEALARFDELTAEPKAARDPLAAVAIPSSTVPDPLRIPQNAATRAVDHYLACFKARDWDALGAQCAPSYVWDDRRKLVRVIGDRDTLVTSSRLIDAIGGHLTRRTLLATAGERLALESFTWSGEDPEFEVECLNMTEVDAEGRMISHVVLDPEERRAANLEMGERYARSDAGQGMPPAVLELVRAVRDRDLARARAAVPDDFVYHDHRRTGVGRLEGADAYVKALAVVFELSLGLFAEQLYLIAAEEHGSLSVIRVFGTAADGGGEFELIFVELFSYRHGKLVASELFELEDLDAARARFAELRPPHTSATLGSE
jgi:hypothetical protein